MSEEHAVVNQPETPAKPVVEGGDAQDLDSLLSEYKPPGESPEQPKEAKDVNVNEELLREMKFLKEEREKTVRESAAKAFEETVKSIKGDLPVPEKWIRAYLNEEARTRPALYDAYINREVNPERWKKIEGAIRKEISDDYNSLPSKQATSIANQVESAVLNAKPQTPNQNTKPVHQMSDGEFDKYVSERAKAHAG